MNASTPADVDWNSLSLTALAGHILSHHHPYTREALDTLQPLLGKVVQVHGAAHPELVGLQALFGRLRGDMELHLMKEERILFPYILALEEDAPLSPPPFGSVANPVRMMMHEHETDDVIVRQMRELTADFTPPPQACASYTRLYEGLRALADDLVQHMHLENTLLFPKAIAAEQTRLGQAAGSGPA